MENVSEFVHCRAFLTLLISIFEVAINRFIGRLVELNKIGNSFKNKKYMGQLKDVFSIVKDSKSGSPTMLKRLPVTCGDVDNARRLRNAIAHNNSKYNDKYETDIINDEWVKVQFETGYEKGAPVLITDARFEHFSRSHIELLHILHNTIQSKFFGHDEGYHYGRERKSIEWNRILSGKKSIQM